MQMLIGQVYKLEGFDYKKNGEDRRRVTFRLGMQKPYKTEKVIDGEKKSVRESAFITCKCFNGLSETIEEFFGGEENKGRFIQLTGHFENEEYDRMVEIDHPEKPGYVIETPVKTYTVVFIVDGFNFLGDVPTRKEASTSTKSQPKTTVVKKKGEEAPTNGVKKKVTADSVKADVEEETEETPF